jgi:hypothetical protein
MNTHLEAHLLIRSLPSSNKLLLGLSDNLISPRNRRLQSHSFSVTPPNRLITGGSGCDEVSNGVSMHNSQSITTKIARRLLISFFNILNKLKRENELDPNFPNE